MHAIVLGSGLKDFSNYFDHKRMVSYDAVLDVDINDLEGHERKFIWCNYESQDFVIISGKLHYYEGYSYEEIVSPLRYAIDILGVNSFVVTSASGGLSSMVESGKWAHIDKIICLPEVQMPLRHRNIKYGNEKNFEGFNSLPRATYAYHQGPSTGSIAEYKMLHALDADVVGMSMLSEYQYLKSMDVDAHFLSIPVCTYFPFQNVEEPDFEEVLKISEASVPVLVELFKKFIASK